MLRAPLVILALIVSAGCNRTQQHVVAVIPKANANVFWQTVHAGTVKGSQEMNIRLIWDGPAEETDIAGEMKIMETMIDRQVDAIAIAPSDRSAFKIAVERATAAHIPVIVFDSAVNTDRYVSYIATDNHAGGELAADRLGAVLHGKGDVVMVKTLPGGASTMTREAGFREELRRRYPNIQILDERFGMASVAQSLAVAENMLTAHPTVDGIFASNESGTQGAAQALKSRGRRLKVVGFDSSPALVSLLEDNWIDSLVVQNPFYLGELTVQKAVAAMRGETIPKKIALPPLLVNSTNLKTPEVQAQLFPDLNRYLTNGSD